MADSQNPFADILNGPYGRNTPYGLDSSFFDFLTKGKSPLDKSPSGAVEEEEEDDGEGLDWKSSYEEMKADFESYRKRVESSRESEQRALAGKLISGFLDIIDYVLYTYHAKDMSGTYTEEDGMILKKLISFLRNYGVTPMDDQRGKPFDPGIHEAVMQYASEDIMPGCVSRVFSNGYFMDKDGSKCVLRYAKVAVAPEN